MRATFALVIIGLLAFQGCTYQPDSAPTEKDPEEISVEESILGWQELEYEVMRDDADNAMIVCTMENIDPMGVHTGESTVVAPQQTLSDRDHQMLRDAALRLIRRLDIKGGCNVQFASAII